MAPLFRDRVSLDTVERFLSRPLRHVASPAIYQQVFSLDWRYRWLVIASTALVAGIGLFVIHMSIDENLLRQACIALLIPLATSLIFAALASRIRSLTFVLSACADFFG